MKGNAKYNITDIANELGVSISTVSRAINGKKGVGEKQRRIILDYVDKIGYQPNQIAQGLSKGRLNIVAIILGDIRNPFYTELVFNIQKILSENGYMSVIFNSEYNVDRELEFINLIGQSNFAGLILVTAQSEQIERAINDLDIPMVLVNRILSSYKGDSVLTDNFQAGYLAVIHLLDKGHSRIGFIKGPEVSSASSQRYEGFLQAMSNYHMKIDERFIFESNLKMENGYSIANQVVAMEREKPTAMVVVNDLTAIGFIDGCRNKGLKIPQDISVISFDDIWVSSLSSIGLTTISQHVEEMSAQTARLMLKQLNGERSNPERIIIPPQLIVRNTTDNNL